MWRLTTVIFFCCFLFSLSCKKEQVGTKTATATPKKNLWILSLDGDTIPSGFPVKRKGRTIQAKDLPAPLVVASSSQTQPGSMPPASYPITLSRSIPLSGGDTIIFGENGVPFPEKIAAKAQKVSALMPKSSTAMPFFKKDRTNGAFDFLTIKEGLPASDVHGYVVDNNGFIWIAGNGGLSRYDGKSFRHYTPAHGLTKKAVSGMVLDSVGNIWLGYRGGGGISKFDGTYFYHYNQSSGLDFKNIGGLKLDHSGHIWAIGYDPFMITKFDGQYATFFTMDQIPELSDYYGSFEYAEGKFWIWTIHSFYELNDEFMVKYDLLQEPDFFYGNYYSGDKTLWIVNRTQFCKIQEGRIDCFTSEIIKEDAIADLLADKECNPVLRHKSGATSLIKEDYLLYTEKGSIEKNGIDYASNTSHLTINGKIWWEKSLEGIVRYDPNAFRCFAFPVSSNSQMGQRRLVSAILEDSKGVMWFGTHSNELIKYNGTTFTTFPKVSELFQFDVIRQIYEDSRGLIWIASNRGMVYYDGKTFTKFNLQDESQNFISFRTITEDLQGNMWFGSTEKGIIKYDGSAFTFYTNESGKNNYDNANASRAMITDRQGNIWIGYQNIGLAKYDGKTFTLYTTKEGLADNHIATLFEDSKGHIWIGTEYGGVSKLVQRNTEASDGATFVNYTMEDGLSANDVWTISEDAKGNLWLGAGGCLNLLFFADQGSELTAVTEYCDLGGMVGAEFFSNATLLDSKNQMWWGSNIELITVASDAINPTDSAPEVFLDEIEINETFIDFNQLSDVKQAKEDYWVGKEKKLNFSTIKYDSVAASLNYPLGLKLPYDFNYLIFRFAATNDRDLSEVKFTYFMEGQDREWSTPSTANKADYRNIRPGTYTFKVKAVGKNQVWSDPLEYTFTITPPWWQTWWAYLLYVCCVVASISYLGQFVLNRRLELKEAKRVKELDLPKTRLYTNITHEFRTPLTVIMGMNERIKDHQQEKNLIRRNSKNLLYLVNQLLDLSKLESGSLKLDNIQGNIVNYLQYLTESFYSMAIEKEIRLTFYSEEEELIMDYDEVKIQHIIYNLLSNAIKFTPAGGKVILHIRESERNGNPYLKMKIKDTGIGIPPDKLPHIFDRFYQVDDTDTRRGEGTGIGLTLVKELVGMMSGQIKVKSDLGKGTEFVIWLPLKREAALGYNIYADEQKKIPEVVTKQKENTTSEIPPATGEQKPEILIIEDNSDVVTYIESLLCADYTIHKAGNGQSGIDAAIELVPDLIISDVMMPEKDGYEVCEILKQDVRTSHIPIVLLTAKAGQEDKVQGLKYGADAFLAKPFDKEELFIRIEKLIELRLQLQSYYSARTIPSESGEPQERAAPIEDEFLKKMRMIIQKRMGSADFSVVFLVHAMAMSHTQLYRKLKALTGKTPSQFIRSIRLQKGYELLKNSDLNISEIAYEVGFSDPGYFSKTFQQEFGYSPSDLQK